MKSVTVVLLVLSLCVAAGISAQTCTPDTILKDYLKNNVHERAQVLAFDHLDRKWLSYDWDGSAAVDTTKELDQSDLDRPRIRLNGDPLRVFVINTNPVIFRVDQKEAALVDSASLAGLKKVLAALGGFAGTAVTATAPSLIQNAGVRMEAQVQQSGRLSVPRVGTAQDLSDAVSALSDQLKTDSKPVADQLQELKRRAQTLKNTLDLIDETGKDLTFYAQLIESRDTSAKPPDPSLIDLPGRVEKNVSDLSDAKISDLPCLKSVAALGRLVQIKLEGLSPKSDEANRTLDEFDQTLAKLRPVICNDDPLLGRYIETLAAWLGAEANRPSNSAPVDGERDLLLVADRHITEYTTLGTQGAAAADIANEILDKRDSAITSATGVAATVRRIHLIPPDPCASIAGVLVVERRTKTEQNLPFGKEGQESFTIKADKPFASVSLQHTDDLEQKYGLIRRSWLDPDVDVALTYTTLKDPTEFKIVKDPANATGLIVRRTKEETRAGQLALMLTGHITRLPFTKYVAPQIGFLASTGNPGAFVGLAIQIGPYIKISGGKTYQKVNRLVNGWKEGAAPPDSTATVDTAVPTRSGFAHQNYVALSFTLDNLSLFNTGN